MSALILLIRERLNHWRQQGLDHREAILALITDTLVPDHLPNEVICDLAQLSHHTLKKRRVQKKPPAFLRVTPSHVVYPKGPAFRWLVDGDQGPQPQPEQPGRRKRGRPRKYAIAAE